MTGSSSPSPQNSLPISQAEGSESQAQSPCLERPSPALPEDLQQFFFGRLNYERDSGVRYDTRNYGPVALGWLLELLGHPERQPVVHIAGTKGKGSVAHMVQRSLQAAGYRTGLYTSPHLHCLSERFVVDGKPLSVEQIRRVVETLKPAVERVDQRVAYQPDWGRLTFFDLCTAAALVGFRQQEVEIAVLEVGMGGRLDSTNVVDPEVSAITTISFDHTAHLGNTLKQIATEKAGIIKPGRPVICGVRQEEAILPIANCAAQRDAPFFLVGRDFQWQPDPQNKDRFQVEFNCPDWLPAVDLQLTMPGAHQRDNAAVAVAILRQLSASGWKISDDAIRTGLLATQVPGRIEVIGRQPLVILDAAHNPASFQALITTLDELKPRSQPERVCRRLVFAVSRDKDYRRLLEQAAAAFDQVLLCQYVRNPRGVPVAELEQCWDEVTAELRRADRVSLPTPEAAFVLGKQRSRPHDVLVAAGSVFLLAELEDCRSAEPV